MTSIDRKAALVAALQTSTPVFFAYVPLGIVFGILCNQLGLPWFLAPIMSATTFAGVVQFTALSYIPLGLSPLELGITATLMCLRNCFYGLSFLDRYNVSRWKKSYLSFSLVDATYAILISEGPRSDVDDTSYCLYLSALIHFYWVFGTLLGVVCLPASVTIPGLEFVLVALFIVLIMEQYRNVGTVRPFVIAGAGAALALAIAPTHMLLVTIVLSVAALYLTYQPEAEQCPQ